MKVVINNRHGGFGLSDFAIQEYARRKGIKLYSVSHGFFVAWYYDGEDERPFFETEIPREDPDLVDIVEKYGEKANGKYSNLVVVEIPDDIEWFVEDYDGREWICEEHRRWYGDEN